MNRAEDRNRAVALVTGGGGFIGRAVIERLLARGWQVRCLARGDYPELAQSGVECWRGDLTDASIVARACAGCDVVFHVAAKAGVWGSYASYHEPNVCGTENVLAGCRAAGVSRLVFTSSPSVVFDGHDMAGADESVPYPERFGSHYSATKARAEQLVLAANETSLRTIALRPHLVWGPRDNHIVPRIIAQAASGRLRFVGDGSNRVDTTYIDNAADAHLDAADAVEANSTAAGRAYFISNGEPMPMKDIVNGILRAAGQPPVSRCVSRRKAIAAASVLEFVHRTLRLTSEPRITRFVAEEMSTAHWFDLSAAQQMIGYQPRVLIKEGLSRLQTWLTTEQAKGGRGSRRAAAEHGQPTH